jgi:hypothetical protein
MAVCFACRKPLRSDNRRGLCTRCANAHRSTRRCAAGCGRVLDRRGHSAICKVCALRLAFKVGNRLATLAEQGDPRAAPVLVAIRELADRPWSEIRLNRLHHALAAFGALPLAAATFLGAERAAS